MTEEKPVKPEKPIAVKNLLEKVEKKPWPSRTRKKDPTLKKEAFLYGYISKKSMVDVNNEYNPAAMNAGNTKWPTSYSGKETPDGQYIGRPETEEEKAPVNQGQSVDDFKVGSPLTKQANIPNEKTWRRDLWAEEDRDKLKNLIRMKYPNDPEVEIYMNRFFNSLHPNDSIFGTGEGLYDDILEAKKTGKPGEYNKYLFNTSRDIPIDERFPSNPKMSKQAYIHAPDTRGAVNKNAPDIPSKVQMPYSGKIVNMGQESQGGHTTGDTSAIAAWEWQNKNQRSEGGQANFDKEEKTQKVPAGIEKMHRERELVPMAFMEGYLSKAAAGAPSSGAIDILDDVIQPAMGTWNTGNFYANIPNKIQTNNPFIAARDVLAVPDVAKNTAKILDLNPVKPSLFKRMVGRVLGTGQTAEKVKEAVNKGGEWGVPLQHALSAGQTMFWDPQNQRLSTDVSGNVKKNVQDVWNRVEKNPEKEAPTAGLGLGMYPTLGAAGQGVWQTGQALTNAAAPQGAKFSSKASPLQAQINQYMNNPMQMNAPADPLQPPMYQEKPLPDFSQARKASDTYKNLYQTAEFMNKQKQSPAWRTAHGYSPERKQNTFQEGERQSIGEALANTWTPTGAGYSRKADTNIHQGRGQNLFEAAQYKTQMKQNPLWRQAHGATAMQLNQNKPTAQDQAAFTAQMKQNPNWRARHGFNPELAKDKSPEIEQRVNAAMRAPAFELPAVVAKNSNPYSIPGGS